MSDYGRPLEFGFFLDPSAASLDEARAIAGRADELGLDLIGIQDHPYQARFLDTMTLMADLLARTDRVRVFPDVASLPLRGPAMLAKQAASLDVLSRGRFELGLGSGAFWEAIAAMGGPARSAGEAVEALQEAIEIIRKCWSGERAITFEGRHYTVRGFHPGPPPVHAIGIWLGVLRPRGLELVGSHADGWVPSLVYAPPAAVPEMQARIDASARAAGRDPSGIRRLYNVGGLIADGPARSLLVGPVSHWAETLTEFAVELGFDTFILWASDAPLAQLERFAKEVAPAVRESVAHARAGG